MRRSRHTASSPLTHRTSCARRSVLGGYVDVLARTDLDSATRARTLAAMRREIDRLTRLSSDLLLLTQLEAGGGRLAARRVDLGDLVEDIGAAARIMGPDQHIEVVRNGLVPVVADPDRLTQALMNLVDNAVRGTRHPVARSGSVSNAGTAWRSRRFATTGRPSRPRTWTMCSIGSIA